MCLPWQQWTETSAWFDNAGISAFRSCIAVDLWQSLSEWRLLLSECILVCRRDVRTNIKFLVKLGKTGSEITVSITAPQHHVSSKFKYFLRRNMTHDLSIYALYEKNCPIV
jgi:hypothetical protein